MFDLKHRLVVMVAGAMLLAAPPHFADEASDPIEGVEGIVALAAAAIVEAEKTTGPGEPALWTLRDEDTVIHLFGTVHVLRPETVWRSPAFEAAFAGADRLILESNSDGARAARRISKLLLKYGVFTNDSTLADYLDDGDEAIVKDALASIGTSLSEMGPSRPWLVNVQLFQARIELQGFDRASGVETILTGEARKDGKSLGYLETLEEQFRAISSGSVEAQIEQLVSTAKMLDKGSETLDALVAEWADGDTIGLGHLVTQPELVGGEAAYNEIIVERNRNWIPQIIKLLDKPGDVFVAVGAAHLAGPDSVIEMLRAEGLTVTQP